MLKRFHEYCSKSIHEKVNNKIPLNCYKRAKHVYSAFVDDKMELMANTLDNLQEYQVRNGKIVNVTYEGMNL